jgi:hypothetical protein
MPMPPILPTIDWPAVFNSGLEFDAWIARAENRQYAEAMVQAVDAAPLPPHVRAALAGLANDIHVVAIAEDWCGDVVRHVPALERLRRAATRLHVRYISRAQYPDVFVRFLTNGGEAIPKFIFLSAKFVECGNWGPMPASCRELIARGKASGDTAGARATVSQLYAADPDLKIVVRELMELIDIAAG